MSRTEKAGVHPPYDLGTLRARIPLLGTTIPMNHCSQGPQSDATRAAAECFLDSWNTSGMDWEVWMREVRLAKEAFARLINASVDEIAVFGSVSEAASAVASALDFGSARATVVVTEAEFPTIGHVWLAQERRGARVRWIPVRDGVVDPADYDRAIDDSCRVVSVTHGYYLNGLVQDLAAVAAASHANGALVFVDAYQSAGAVPIDVKASGVDFLASGCLKYLMGTAGIAFLYVRREIIESLEPTMTGWFGREDPFAFKAKTLDWAPTASRFDSGTPPVINAYIARAGMETILGLGVDAIRGWHEVLAKRLMEGAEERGLVVHGTQDTARKTANTAIVVADSQRVETAMRQRGVLPSARGPVIRLAPHFYSTFEDVDTALDTLAAVMSGR